MKKSISRLTLATVALGLAAAIALVCVPRGVWAPTTTPWRQPGSLAIATVLGEMSLDIRQHMLGNANDGWITLQTHIVWRGTMGSSEHLIKLSHPEWAPAAAAGLLLGTAVLSGEQSAADALTALQAAFPGLMVQVQKLEPVPALAPLRPLMGLIQSSIQLRGGGIAESLLTAWSVGAEALDYPSNPCQFAVD